MTRRVCPLSVKTRALLLRIPDCPRIVEIRSDDTCPVWAEDRACGLSVRHHECDDRLASPGVPHLRGLIKTGGREPRAVRAERHAEETVGVPLEGEGVLPVPGIPYVQSAIPARKTPLAVGAECDAMDLAGVPLEGEGFPPASTSQTLTVRSQLTGRAACRRG